MASIADSRIAIPGLPSREHLAYLAGLLDRGGSFTVGSPTSIGLAITGPPELRRALISRFAGTESGKVWYLRRQADLRFLLPRLQPFLTIRVSECIAMRHLLDHLTRRDGFPNQDYWREDRTRLMAAVRESRPRSQTA